MRRKGFTVLEAILLIVAIAIIAAVLFPVFARPDRGGRRPSCQSNLKQIALGFKQYIQDFDEKYPIAKNSNHGLDKTDNWAGEIHPYLKSTQIFICPSDENAKLDRSSYAYNARLSKIKEMKLDNSALIVLNFEVVADPNNWTQTGSLPAAVSASTRHLDGSNFSFVDGHVKWFKPGKVGAASPKSGNPTFMPG
jgi:prepilin-type processing-associated H-X9-DG protein